MWREINRLKEISDVKTIEAGQQADRLRVLNHEISRVQAKIEDTTKIIEVRSHDLNVKHKALEDTERELVRTRD